MEKQNLLQIAISHEKMRQFTAIKRAENETIFRVFPALEDTKSSDDFCALFIKKRGFL
nr:hypothetical protein [uncultured Sellimonas sp.]